jgi:hypothetical protein
MFDDHPVFVCVRSLIFFSFSLGTLGIAMTVVTMIVAEVATAEVAVATTGEVMIAVDTVIEEDTIEAEGEY